MMFTVKSWIGLVSLLVVGALPSPAPAEDLTVMGIDWAPITMGGESGLSGIGVEIIDQLAKATGNRVVAKVEASSARVNDESGKPNVVFAHLTRTPEREAKFHWIGKIADDRNCFATKKGNPAISSFEQAKKVRIVGVNAGGAAEKTLRDNGVTNLEVVARNGLNVRKLAAGRIDAWYTTAMIAAYTIKKEGLNPADFECSGDVPRTYYVAASLTTPAPVVDALKKAHKELEDKGVIKQIVAKY